MEVKYFILKIIVLSLLIFSNCSPEQNSEFENEIEEFIKNDFNQHHDNIEMLTYFNDLSWKRKLSSKNVSIINSVIDLGNYRYKEMEANVMVPVLVHRLNSINKKENLYRWEEYRNFLKETLNLSDEEYDKFLLANIRSNKLRKFNENISHYRVIDDQILNALVIRQCRLLRNGKKQTVAIDKNMLNSFHLNALEQSKYSNHIAIQNLTEKIANLGILLTKKEYGILSTLNGYGKRATENTIKIVKDSTELQKFTQRGKYFLLLHLLQRTKIDLTQKRQEKLVKYLNQKEIYDGLFVEDKDVIARITSRLTGENYEVCMNRIGIYNNKEAHQKFIERIANQKEMKKNKR